MTLLSPLRWTATLALVLYVATPAWAQSVEAPTQPQLSDEQIATIESGELVVQTRRGTINRGEVVGLVCAPIDEVWTIIRDFNHLHVWYPDMEESELVGPGHGRGRTNMPWPISDRRWELAATHGEQDVDGIASRVATFDYIEGTGNLETMFGYWLVREWDNGCTMVRYVINADLGVALPSSILSWATRRMLPGIVTGLRERHDDLY